MEIKIGNIYRVIDKDDDVTTLKVIEMDSDGDFYCKILASTDYEEGSKVYFSQDMFDDMKEVLFLRGDNPPMEKIDTIKMNSTLKALFIDLALRTGDKKWFLELTSCKEGVC